MDHPLSREQDEQEAGAVLRVTNRLLIPRSEFRWTYSRSSGPGGQNVNKVNSKATMHWPAMISKSLPVELRMRLRHEFGNRLNNEGELVIAGDEHRDLKQNMVACEQRLVQILRTISIPPKVRRPTKPSKASNARRLQEKKHRANIRNSRRIDPQ